MYNYQPVILDTHQGKSWQRYTNFSHAAGDAICPLYGVELARAALSMPLAFVEVNGEFIAVAITGLVKGVNLLVNADGRWLTPYVPALVRSYPFNLGVTPTGARSLCVDADSKLVVDSKEFEPFFNEDGTLPQAIVEVMQFFKELEGSRQATADSIAALKAAGVIVPWDLRVKSGDVEAGIEGLFRIDEAALNALGDEAFLSLRKNGALAVAYSQLLSMPHLQTLAGLARARANNALQSLSSFAPQQTAPTAADDLATKGTLH
ncbi:MAG: peptidase [Rhodocyclales bacterium GT-UBC]|nr:MAG: peptidase [Rhodocyclales bacterium GT-UBC]